MDEIRFLGIIETTLAYLKLQHKTARTQQERCYTIGQIDALDNVVKWLKLCK